MLTDFQGDRYPSAQAVLADLQGENSTELFQSLPVAQVVEAPTQPPSSGWGPGKFLAMLAVMACVLSLGAGWYTRDRWLPLVQPSPSLPPQEQARKEDLTSRSQALGVDHQFLTQLTNATFYQRYPERQGNPLSNDPAEVEWRLRWDAIANEWLTLLEQNLSTAARQRLGQYSDADRTQWRETVNQLHVGSRSLFDLTDARFFHLFPEQRGQAFIDQPIGQIWQAIATDQVNALQNGKTLQTITFGANAFNQQIQGSLAPGEGRVFIADLREGQILRLNLQSSAPQSLLSIYLPRPTQETPFLLEDSAETTWAGRLTQAGYYEIVVVSYAAEPLSYVLNVAVDNVTSSPAKSAPPPENKN
jgi:serine/threonine-protein kinase